MITLDLKIYNLYNIYISIQAKDMKSLIIEMDCGSMYDTEGEILPAIQSRLTRRILPRLTDSGCVEYGVQIPSNYTSRQPRNARLGGSSITGSKYGPEGNDIDWIMKGSGNTSSGSTGLNLIPKVTVIPSSGKQHQATNENHKFGSTASVGGNDYANDILLPSSNDNWNRHRPIPGIG